MEGRVPVLCLPEITLQEEVEVGLPLDGVQRNWLRLVVVVVVVSSHLA